MPMPPRMVTWKGQTKPIGTWAEELGVSRSTIARRDTEGTPLDAPVDPGKRAAATAKRGERPPRPAPRPRRATPSARTEAAANDPCRLLERLGVVHELLSRTPAGVAVFFPA